MNLAGPLKAVAAYAHRMEPSLLLHTITVETFEGSGALGSVYSEPVTLSPDTDPETGVMVDETTRLVRASDGTEKVSSSTITARIEQADQLKAGSRVTLPSGDVTTIITRSVRVGGALPDRVQVSCE